MKIIISIMLLSSVISGTAMAADWSAIKDNIKIMQAEQQKQTNTRGFFFCIPCII